MVQLKHADRHHRQQYRPGDLQSTRKRHDHRVCTCQSDDHCNERRKQYVPDYNGDGSVDLHIARSGSCAVKSCPRARSSRVAGHGVVKRTFHLHGLACWKQLYTFGRYLLGLSGVAKRSLAQSRILPSECTRLLAVGAYCRFPRNNPLSAKDHG